MRGEVAPHPPVNSEICDSFRPSPAASGLCIMTVSIPAALPEDGSSFRGDRAAIQTGGGANDAMLELIPSELVLLGSILVVAAAAVATVHAALYKDEVRTAIGWVAVIVLVPFVGTLLYYLIGINRIRRRAVALRRENERSMLPLPPGWLRPTQVGEILGGSADAAAVANVVGKIDGPAASRWEPHSSPAKR